LVGDRAHLNYSRVVHQDVDRSQPPPNLVDHIVDPIAIGHVRDDRENVDPFTSQHVSRTRQLDFVPSTNRDPATVTRELARQEKPQPT
jgi:hypothetical protein